MPGPLDALERLMEEAVEGSVQRVFRPKLQPVRLARAAARQMDEQHVVGPRGLVVPNHYTVSLNPADFERFARFQVALERELKSYLVEYARDHAWRPVGEVIVALVADPAVARGRSSVRAQMLDVADEEPGLPAGAVDAPIDRTVRLRPVTASESAEPVTAPPTPCLVNELGERFVLARPIMRIGRALENDVVIPDLRVSRFHAELRQQGDRWVLHDLGSTNGTWVAEFAVDKRELRDGEAVSLGGYRLTFQRD